MSTRTVALVVSISGGARDDDDARPVTDRGAACR
jgi:hypothetical protein